MNSPENSTKEIENKGTEDDLASRRCALEILHRVINKRTALDIALDSSGDFAHLTARDRAFTRMLITTTIRRLGQIDDLITSAMDRPDALKTDVVLNIMRLGVTQIFFMDVADHAAVDTAVRLADEKGMSRQKGFVNAILRTLIREGAARIQKQDAPRLNTPEWLLKLWIEDYGLSDAARIAEANMSEAPLDITVKNIGDRPYWGNVLQASELSTGTLRRVLGGNIRERVYDAYLPYTAEDKINPVAMPTFVSGETEVFAERGGSYACRRPEIRWNRRNLVWDYERDIHTGFRLARILD